MTDTKTNYTWYGSGNAGPDKLTSAVVTFSPNPVVTGADKTTPGAIFTAVTATVSPKDLASSVSVSNFVNSGAGRVEVENSSPNNSTGVISFDVFGTAGTSASMPNGDVQMQAKDGSTLLGTAEVTVVIPAAIGTPHPTFNGAVASKNAALNASTVPAWWGAPAGQVELFTEAGTSLSVPVVNQFGKSLNAVYNGQTVYEGGKSINVTVSGGHYSDWVGTSTTAPPAWKPNPCQQGSPEEQNWLAAPTGTVANNSGTQNIQVEIAGFTLNPSVANRKVTYNNGNLTVTWP